MIAKMGVKVRYPGSRDLCSSLSQCARFIVERRDACNVGCLYCAGIRNMGDYGQLYLHLVRLASTTSPPGDRMGRAKKKGAASEVLGLHLEGRMEGK